VPPEFPALEGLHHYAYRCRNGEETRHFYEDLLGLPLAVAVVHDRVPSTNEHYPYCHIFFELQDGSYLAFFDLLDGRGPVPDATTPPWVHHIALRVASRRALLDAKARLEAEKIEVVGIVDHGWFDSIYFFDPNGIRLELVSPTASTTELAHRTADAHGILAQAVGATP
jgi:catechol 2,3-dioxygenase-like lactoylglutathione lyase family enzyme